MLTPEEVKQICSRLSQEQGGAADDAMSEDVSEIVYRIDVTDCGDAVFVDRHIDIEYSYGDYYEIQEDTPLFSYIGTLCELPLAEEDQEIVLYEGECE